MKDRVFFKKSDILIIAIIAALPIASLFWSGEAGDYATVSVGGLQVLKIDFDNNFKVYDIDSQPTLQVVYNEHGVAVINAMCDDKLCEAAGHLTSGGDRAVCLPATVVVHVHGESEVDYIAS